MRIKLLIAVFNLRHQVRSELVFENHYRFMRAADGFGIIDRRVGAGQQEFIGAGSDGRIAKRPAADVAFRRGQ